MRKIYAMLLAIGVLGAAPWAVTQAVFSDSQEVGANTFATGTVDISTSPSTALVEYSAMAPGDSDTSAMVVSNPGSLALRYAVTSVATNADAKALKDQLVMVVKTVDATDPGTPCDTFDGTEVYSSDLDGGASGKVIGDVVSGNQSGDRTLDAAASETLCFRVTLPSSSGDSYQNAATTGTFTFSAEQTKNNA